MIRKDYFVNVSRAAVEKLALDGVSVEGVHATFSPQFEHIWLESKRRLPKFVAEEPANLALRGPPKQA
jgi:hypothetical protein